MAMTLIQRTILTGSQASITFNSIPQTYQTLIIQVSNRMDATSTSMGMRFNNDSGSNYTYLRIYGTGTATASSTATSTTMYVCDSNGTDMTASTYSSIAITVPNYTKPIQKSVSAEGVVENNASNVWTPISATSWNSTAAVTSLTILMWAAGSGNFVAGSTFSLYGLS